MQSGRPPLMDGGYEGENATRAATGPYPYLCCRSRPGRAARAQLDFQVPSPARQARPSVLWDFPARVAVTL